MKKLNPYMLAAGLLPMCAAILFGTLDYETTRDLLVSPLLWFTLVVGTFLLIALVAIYRAHDSIVDFMARKEGRLPESEDEESIEVQEEADQPGWVERLLQKLQDSKPVEEEEEIELDHEYDGIRELDNNLPPWWLYGFYASIIFSVIYVVRYHVTESAPLQEEEYQMEMAAAAAAKEEYLKTAANLVDESNVTYLSEEPRLKAGGKIYAASCAVCHAPDGGGGVGPNLTDEYWIHGGSIADVFGTIKYGVPSKGMIPWKDQLSPTEIQEVASYILSLQGTEPADPKEAEGDLYEEAPAEDEGEIEETAQEEGEGSTAGL